VTEVVNEVKAIKKAIFKSTIVRKEKNLGKKDPIWGELTQ
jgi:hypothetical protein